MKLRKIDQGQLSVARAAQLNALLKRVRWIQYKVFDTEETAAGWYKAGSNSDWEPVSGPALFVLVNATGKDNIIYQKPYMLLPGAIVPLYLHPVTGLEPTSWREPGTGILYDPFWCNEPELAKIREFTQEVRMHLKIMDPYRS